LFNGYSVLGDSPYPNNNVMVSIFRGNNLPAAAEAFNRVMCPIRTCVEWGYAKIMQYWAFVDFKKTNESAISSDRSIVVHCSFSNECCSLGKRIYPDI
jgi:hypothetical protein